MTVATEPSRKLSATTNRWALAIERPAVAPATHATDTGLVPITHRAKSMK